MYTHQIYVQPETNSNKALHDFNKVAFELDGVPINLAEGCKVKIFKKIKENRYYPYINEFRVFLTGKFTKKCF